VETSEVIHASDFAWHSNTKNLYLQNPCDLEVSRQLPTDRELEHTKSKGIAARHRQCLSSGIKFNSLVS